MKKYLKIIIPVLVLFLVVGAVIAKTRSVKQEEEKAPPAVAVETLEVVEGEIERTILLTGKVSPVYEVQVTPKYTGRVARINVDVGDWVKSGQTLLVFENEEAALGVEQAEAALEMVCLQLQTAEQALTDAERNLARMEELHAAGAISEQQLEQVQLQCEQARAAADPAQLKQAETALKQAQLQYNNSILKAPAAGVITARQVDPGEMAGATMPVFNLVDMDRVLIEVGVSESEVNHVKPGQEVSVRVAAVSSEPFEGKVAVVSPAADPQTRTYQVKVELDNSEHLLKPGMFAEIELVAESKTGVIVVPREVVLERENRKVVFIVEDEHAREVPVELGLVTADQVEIIEGLEVRAAVVSRGQHFLVDGSQVALQDGGEEV